MSRSPRLLARVAGVLYLVTHVTSVTAVAAYSAGALTLGVALELALAIGCLGTGVVLLALLRRHGEVRAMTFAGLRTVEAAVIIAGALPMLALAWLGDAGTANAEALTQLHAAAFLLGQGLVISVNTLVLASLLLDARVVPRALALLGLAGGAIVLASNLAQLFGAIPLNGAVAGLCALPIFAFELWFAGLLIFKGRRLVPDREPALAG